MKSLLPIVTGLLISLTATGCCCMRHNACVDPCDPAMGVASSVGHKPWKHHRHNWKARNQARHMGNASCGDFGGGCCDDGCGSAGNMIYDNGASGMMPMSGSAGGGCASCGGNVAPGAFGPIPAGSGMMAPPLAPAPPSSGSSGTFTTDPVPVPPTTFNNVPGQTQHVSYEEFQRLPGVIVSGPGSEAASMASGPSLQPLPTTVATPTTVNSAARVTAAQPAAWTPVR